MLLLEGGYATHVFQFFFTALSDATTCTFREMPFKEQTKESGSLMSYRPSMTMPARIWRFVSFGFGHFAGAVMQRLASLAGSLSPANVQ